MISSKDICYHIHTKASRCASYEMDLESIVRTCEKLNYKIASISDHIYNSEINSLLDEEGYCLKELGSEVDIYLSAEAESHIPGRFALGIVDRGKVDFLTLALTHSGGFEECVKRYGIDYKAINSYMADLYLGVEVLDNIGIVAHPLRIEHLKFVTGEEVTPKIYDEFYEYMSKYAFNGFFESLANKGASVEISPHSVFSWEYSLDFYTRAREKGVKIAISADAHNITQIAIDEDIHRLVDETGNAKNLYTPANPPFWKSL